MTGQQTPLDRLLADAAYRGKFDLRAHRAILQDLLGNDWLAANAARKPRHLGIRRYVLIEQIEGSGGNVPLHNHELMVEIAAMVLDSHYLVQATRGDVGRMTLGSLANYGDEKVQKRVRAVAREVDQISDVMFELSFAAWHLSQGDQVVAQEEEGQADLILRSNKLELPMAVDCKRISSDSKLTRIAKVIKKASGQVRAVPGDHYGLVAIDVTEWCASGVHELETIERETSAVMAGPFNRRLSGALLVWHQSDIRPYPNGDVFVALRRMSKLIPHANAERPLRDLSFSAIGNAVVYWIRRRVV